MKKLKQIIPGILLCLAIAIPTWLFGKAVPVIGGPVFAIFIGMMIAFVKIKPIFNDGIKYTSKKIITNA